jgi:hypothetical protein
VWAVARSFGFWYGDDRQQPERLRITAAARATSPTPPRCGGSRRPEFGPNGSFDDWEYLKVATRFGVSRTYSRESFGSVATAPDNTTSSSPIASTCSISARWHRRLGAGGPTGWSRRMQGSVPWHLPSGPLLPPLARCFVADSALPVDSIDGLLPAGRVLSVKQLELYGATSWVFSDDSAGFGPTESSRQRELVLRIDPYRLNAQVIRVIARRSVARSLLRWRQKGHVVAGCICSERSDGPPSSLDHAHVIGIDGVVVGRQCVNACRSAACRLNPGPGPRRT